MTDTPTSPPGPTRPPAHALAVGLWFIVAIAVIYLLRDARDVLLPIVLATLLFYALGPIVTWMARRGVPRGFAAAFVVLGLLGACGYGLYSLRDEAAAVLEELPRAARNMRTALKESRTGRRENPVGKMQEAAREVDKVAAEATTQTSVPQGVMRVQVEDPFRASEYLWSGSMGILTGLGQLVVIILLTFFLLLTGDLFKRKLITHAGDTLASKRITLDILSEIEGQIGRFILVQMFTSAVVGVVTATALWWLGLNQPIVWGLAAGFFNSIPYFGPFIVTSAIGLVAFLQFGTPAHTAAAAGIALAVTTLEGWFLTPALMSKAVRMNQPAVFVSLLFWSWIWGVWGLFLAVPMTVVLKSICDRVEGLQAIGDFLGEDARAGHRSPG